MHIRCSQLPTFMACPSSLLPAENPIRDTSEASELGTAVHEALAVMVVGDEVDLNAISSKHGCDLDELEYLFESGCEAWNQVHHHFDSPSVEMLQSVKIGNIQLTGHTDISTVASVADWKSGRVRYNPRWQLNGYGRMGMAHIGVIAWLRDRDFEIFRLMKSEDFDKDLLAQVEKIGKEFSTGEHCGHCERRLECETYKQDVVQAVSLVKTDVYTVLSRDNLAELYPLLRIAEKQIGTAVSYIRDDIRQNGPLPLGDGTELALQIQSNRILDAKKGWQALSESLSPEGLAAVVKISITALEKQIKAEVPKDAKRGAKGAAVREVMGKLKAADALSYKEIEKLGKRACSNGE